MNMSENPCKRAVAIFHLLLSGFFRNIRLSCFVLFLFFSALSNVLSAQACNTPWNSSSVYASPTSVSHNGRNYTSKWWTQGNQPGSDPSGVWTDNGACNSCATVNPGIIGSAQSIVSGATPNSLTNISAASGGNGASYIYQWQVSTNNSAWTDISGANSTTYSPGALTANTYYRRKATSGACGDGFTSSVLMSIVAPIDSDGDGVFNHIDLDDDNDGILDTQECGVSNFGWSSTPNVSGNTASGNIFSINYNYTSTTSVQTTSNIYNHGIFPASYGIPNTTSIQNLAANTNTLTFSQPVLNPVLVFSSIGSGGLSVPIVFNKSVEVLWSSSVVVNSSTMITGTEGYAIVRFNGIHSSVSFDYLVAEGYANFMFGADLSTQTSCDTDADGIDNTLDLDSDGDGCADAIEGGAAFTVSNLTNDRLSGSVDANGVPVSATVSGQTIGTSQLVAVSDAACPPCPDNDADGVCNTVDLDDDNDGILDVTECPAGNFQWSTPPTVSGTNTATGTINGFVNYTYTSDKPVQTETVFQGIGSFPAQYNFTGGTNVMNTQVSSNTITFSQPVTDPILAFGSIGAGGFPVGITFSNPVEILWSQNVVQNSSTQITGSEGHTIVKLKGVFSQFSFDYLVSEFRVNFAFGADFTNDCDIDNDGIANSFDLDSDADGCADAVEGGAAFKSSNLTGQRLSGSVDSKGVPVVATASGQTVGSSQNENIQDSECCIKPTVSTSDTKVCVGASITASPATGGAWTSSNTSVATISNAGVIAGVTAGSATFTFTNTGGCSSTTNTVTVNTKPVVNLVNASICAGDPAATFDAGAGFASYTWSNNGSGNLQKTSGTNTGAYTVVVADANGCKDTASANLALKTNCGCVNDNDQDGVCDEDDLDDDNDGILDVVECEDVSASWDFETPVVGGGNNNQGNSFQGWTCTSGGWINLIHPPYSHPTVPQTAASGNQYVEVGGSGDFSRPYSVASAGVVTVEIDFASWAGGTEQTQINIFKSDGTTLVAQSPVITTPPVSDWNKAWQNKGRVSALLQPGDYVIKFSLGNFQAFDNVKISSANLANCDTDNDGIVNTLDTDSDGDGCADAVEGGASFKKTDLTNNALSGAVDAKGVPVVAGAAGQSVGASANSLSVDVDCACAKPLAPIVDGSSSEAIHSFNFSATQALNETTPVFENGKKYQYKVTGTWSVWSNDPNKNALDAAFRYADNSTGALLGSPFSYGYIKLDGNTFPRPDTNVYKANHEYWYSFTGQGNALNFTFTDSPYSDNHGSLKFTFYALADTIKVCANNSTKTLSDYVTGTNLLWYTSETGGAGSAVSPNVNNSAAGAHSYWVSQTLNDCESDRSLLIYKVEAIPNLTIVGDTAICEGDAAVLFDAGVGYASYAWSGTKTASTQSISANVVGVYQVVASSAIGCKDTASVKLAVHPKPQVVLTNATICSGDAAVTFDAGAGYSSYLWSANGIGNAQTTAGKNAGSYTVKVSDANGCKDTATALLTVNTKPNISLADTALCAGDVAGVFNAAAGFTSYTWAGKGTGTAQSTARTIAGIYTVSVVNANGCKDTASATLIINTKPTIALSDTTICAGDKAGVFSVSGQFASYAWSGNGAGTAQTSARTSAGVYSLSVIDVKGCKDTSSATLTINTKPNVIISNDTICEGDAAVTFDAGAGYSSYLWSANGIGNAQTTAGKNAGSYTVKVSDANGCKDTASAVLKVNQKPNVKLASLPPVCLDISSLALKGGNPLGGFYEIQQGTIWQKDSVVQIKNKAAGSYAIRYTYSDANSCVNTASINLVINDLPTLTIGDQEICEGESATFDAGTTFQKYLWSTGWNQKSISTSKAGTYGVLVTDANGCFTADTMNLKVNALPMVYLGADQKVCEGEVVVLSSLAPALNYLWSDGSSNAQLTVNKSGKYILTVSDSNACKNNDKVAVTVVPFPTVDLGDDQEICEGDSITLTVSDAKANYVWSTNEKSATIIVGSSQSLILAQYYDTQCMVRDSISVVVIPKPVSKLGSDTAICFGETLGGSLSLEASSFTDNYLWSDGSTNSTIAITTKGNYSVTMTNGKNCVTYDEIKVNEFCKASIFMPNAFTPNNDGKNDVFFVKGMYVDDFHLLIFNRWGEVVFESYDINDGWDGTLLGDQVQIDVYVVKLFYKEDTEAGYTTKNEMISSLTLIR